MQIRFDMAAVRELIDWNRKNTQAPSTEDLFEPSYYPKGKVVYRADGWPDVEHLQVEKLPRSLWLVKDQGLYLMAGTNEKLPSKTPGSDRQHVVYAEGCDPYVDADWWNNADMAFGGDDGAVNIPIDWIDIALEKGPKAKNLVLNIEPGRVRLMVPSRPSSPDSPQP